jgi:glutathione synthase/RimK-type ligase-like ATP-grasp enzyme
MIAIHNSNSGFHSRWLAYCKQKGIPFKLVNCFANDLISQLEGCNVLMWHHSQNDPKALLAAKSILFALEHAGIKVFPDFRTNWHFDDKVGQKYLLEALNIPLAQTWVFYSKQEALNWCSQTTFPKVFKLRRGAGSSNVRLIKTQKEAERVIRKAFGQGFTNYDGLGNLKERYRKWKLGKTTTWDVIKGMLRLFKKPAYNKIAGRESGYVYFQEFIPGNDHDIRVIVIGDKAFAIKRMVRYNDFRASGSGHILYEKEHFKDEWIQLAFQINDKIKAQSLALDYVFKDGNPVVVEISYGFAPEGYDSCVGYWDRNLNWYEGPIDPYGWMIDLAINEKR